MTERYRMMPGSRHREIFSDYVRYSVASERVNDPNAFIAYLRQTRFHNGELDNLPKHAIILHDSRPEEFLDSLHISREHIRTVQTGVTDPNLLYVVTPPERAAFLLNRGMPGGGGVATQAAELIALGATHLVHVGTCGLVGETVPSGAIVVSMGAYTDGAAALLARSQEEAQSRVAFPDQSLTQHLIKHLADRGELHFSATSYTIPIFYYQPGGLITDLINGQAVPGESPVGYFEMEEAPFFATCKIMGAAAASMVVGSDRYRIVNGELTHVFEDDVDQDATELRILEVILDSFAATPLPDASSRVYADFTARPYDRKR